MKLQSGRGYLALEVALFFLFNFYAAKLAGLAASALGITLPDMPLLRHTYIAFLAILLLMLWLRWRGERLARFGLIRPRLRDLGWGVALAVVTIVADSLVRSVTTPLIVAWTGANPHLDAQTFAALRGDLPLFLGLLPFVWLFAAFGEEFFYRGYLLNAFSQLLGGGRVALAFGIVGQALLFGFAHWYQGPVGMVPIGAVAILTGIATTAWGRNLWPAMVAHGLVDTLGFTLLYFGQPLS